MIFIFSKSHNSRYYRNDSVQFFYDEYSLNYWLNNMNLVTFVCSNVVLQRTSNNVFKV